MDVTPILHKPVSYGGEIANLLFNSVVVLHVVLAVAAVVAGLCALVLRKGGRGHVQSGRVFLYSMAGAVVAGIGLDWVRLTFFVTENHTAYPGAGMPSTYPARLAFIFAGICILYMLYRTTPQTSLRQGQAGARMLVVWIPALLAGAGIGLTAVIVKALNPWTGGLWIIWTFMALVLGTAYFRYWGMDSREGRVDLHRFAMIALAAFSWWGAWQGFRPAVVRMLGMGAEAAAVYTGDQPGEYSTRFWWFLLYWLPWFVVGGLLTFYFKQRRPRGDVS